MAKLTRIRTLIGSALAVSAAGCALEVEDEPQAAVIEQELYGPGVQVDILETSGPIGAVGLVTGTSSCSGTLVERRDRVLTAAHCVPCSAGSRASFKPAGLYPTIGADVVCSPYRNTGTHNFTGPLGPFDVAVLELDHEVPESQTEDVQEVFLGRQNPALFAGPFLMVGLGQNCRYDQECPIGVRRWGERPAGTAAGAYWWTRPCDWPENLFTATCSHVPLWGTTLNGPVNISMGDSGGPLYRTYEGRHVVVGVLSVISHFLDMGFYAQTAAHLQAAQWLASALGLPQDVTRGRLAVYGGDRVSVNDRARVQRYEPGAQQPAVGSGNQLVLGVDSMTHDAFARGTMFLRSRAQLTGLAKAWDFDEQTGVEYAGGRERRVAVLPSLDAYQQFLDDLTFHGGPTLNYEPDQTPAVVTLEPGHYGRINVKRGRTLQLSSGVYYVDYLNLDSESRLQLANTDEPVWIFSRQGYQIRARLLGPGVVDLFLATRATGVTLDTPSFSATIVAPNARIELPPGHRLYGALYGRDVTIHQDSRVYHVRFPYSWQGPN